MQWKWAHSITTSISGEDVTFIHNTFPGPPSDRAIIDYSVCYHYSAFWDSLMLGIYTTQDHVNMERKCTHKSYGQVRNTDMHHDLESRYRNCNWVAKSTRHCVGRITVRDFIPRIISFSLGFRCDDFDYPVFGTLISLKGLTYNISIYQQTESSACFLLSGDSKCHQYYHYGGFPNLFTSLSFSLINNFQCYQHAIELSSVYTQMLFLVFLEKSSTL